MKWFFALNQSSLMSARSLWEPMIVAALNSARRTTSVEPHLLFDGGDDPFIEKLATMGVQIVRHRVSFYEDLKSHYSPLSNYLQVASGAFLRVEIPLIEIYEKFVLYTDCDVLFERDLDLEGVKPKYFACGPEFQKTNFHDFNTGVMVMNLEALRRDLPNFITFIRENLSRFETYDQDAYRIYYRQEVERLSLEYNWKPYWGRSDKARIIHFHGPKPTWAQHLLEMPDDTTVPALHTIFHWNVDGYRHYLGKWQENTQM